MFMKIKKQLTFKEKEQQKIESDLKHIKEDYAYIPEPTYLFNVGDKVTIGSLKDCTIEKIIDNGKLYVVDYTHVNNNYGNPIETKHSKIVSMWADIRKMQNNTISLIENTDIDIRYSQREISSLLNHTYHFGFNLNPDYQRGDVWTLKDKQNLISSIFKNIDIGKFTFIKPDYIMDDYEVLDGKQRLTTILEYYEDRFEYSGFKFSDLCKKDQRHFRGYNISWGESSGLTKEQKLRYFIKLNTTGKIMSQEHIDKVKEMLKELK